jgi:hypothetical protein
VHPLGPVRFSIHFFSIPQHDTGVVCGAPEYERDAADLTTVSTSDEGGDPACWVHFLCLECGAVLDGGPHVQGCPSGESTTLVHLTPRDQSKSNSESHDC